MSNATLTPPATAPRLGDLDLATFTVGDDPVDEARIAIPISAENGSLTTFVYLEVDPGKRIPPHTHSADEVFVVLAGKGIVIAGDEQFEASAGAIVVAPAYARHSWTNTGDEVLKLAGFLPAGTLVTEFDELVTPFGAARFVTPIV